MWELPEEPDRAIICELVQQVVQRWQTASADDRKSTAQDADINRHTGRPLLTTWFPELRETQFLNWLGPRLIVWPGGICPLRRVAVISSRLGQRHDQYAWWYDLLRTAVLRIADTECLCVAAGTTAFEASKRAGQLFGRAILEVRIAEKSCTQQELVDWLLRHVRQLSRNSVPAAEPDVLSRRPGQWSAWVSPAASDLCASAATSETTELAPARDRLQVLASQKTYVLSSRAGGHVEQLLCRRLSENYPDPPVTLAASTSGHPVAEPLLRRGVIPWIVSGVSAVSTGDASEQPSSHQPQQVALSAAVCDQNDGPLQAAADWLCHWTRPCPGPWPDQPEDDFLDELILGCRSADRSALATLLRIATTARLTGSVRADAVANEVVSFTEVPLAEFRQRRIFRRHRHRYDFEPWGVAVRRQTLQQLGAQPVIYGDDSARQQLPESQQVYFQPAVSRSGVDWTAEREWRLAKALDLSQLPAADVRIFVDNPAQTTLFEPFPWQVLVCP